MGVTLNVKECDRMRILVVEDDHLLNHTLCYNLNAARYTVDSALTKQEAKDFLTKQDYDLIVLDVNLPDGDGFSLFGKLREGRDVPVLFLSARDEDADRLQGLGLGRMTISPSHFFLRSCCSA